MYNNDFRLDLNDIDIIEASLIYRLKRLSARREKVKKNLSKNEAADTELAK